MPFKGKFLRISSVCWRLMMIYKMWKFPFHWTIFLSRHHPNLNWNHLKHKNVTNLCVLQMIQNSGRYTGLDNKVIIHERHRKYIGRQYSHSYLKFSGQHNSLTCNGLSMSIQMPSFGCTLNLLKYHLMFKIYNCKSQYGVCVHWNRS